MAEDRLQRLAESKRSYVGSFLAAVLIAISFRWFSNVISPWCVGDDLNVLYSFCSLVVMPMVGLAAVIYLFFYILAYVLRRRPNWQEVVSLCAGLVLVGAFVYFSLPLVEALVAPVGFSAEGESHFGRECEQVKEGILQYASTNSSYEETMNTWMDIDGDGDLERWGQVHAKTGGITFESMVFIYEASEPQARWCGEVLASQSFLAACIKPVNLDLDLAPEIWMRDAVSPLPIPTTSGFVDFSANEVKGFDPRLQILFVLLPVRVLPLLVWFWVRKKPVLSFAVFFISILVYVIISGSLIVDW